jgi:tRNA A37 threonylcarbamoyladenosine dehydratase
MDIQNNNWNLRTKLLIGESSVERLKKSTIVVLGLGGVGGSCAEALCRAGIGKLVIVDKDVIDITNINRQVIATTQNIGNSKVQEVTKRLRSINPQMKIIGKQEFYLPDNSEFIFEEEPDYIVDAIDTMSAKIHLAVECYKRGVKLISCMGMGNRLDPTLIRVGDISDTKGYGCAVSRVIRRELRKYDVPKLKVLYSTEKAPTITVEPTGQKNVRHSPGSISCVPPVAGYILASQVIRSILDYDLN